MEKGDIPTTAVRPAHYQTDGIEPIAYIRSHGMNFCQGNVIKYVTRYLHKGIPLIDLKKARQYLDWLIEEEEEKAKPDYTISWEDKK